MQYCHSIELKPGKVKLDYIIFTFTNDPRIPPREEDEVWTICPPVADDILPKRSNPAMICGRALGNIIYVYTDVISMWE